MHTSEELRPASFAITAGGHRASLDAVLPGCGEHDRLGVVVRRAGAGLGASLLILAAVTAFYEEQRRRGGEFFIYPDHFVFHVGGPHGDHRKLDIWPEHKEVVVAAGGETLLRAVNDRGVTRLLVEDGPPGAPGLRPETVASARRRLVTCLAYAPGGRAAGGDVTIAGDAAAERFVAAAAASLPPGTAESVMAARRALAGVDGRPVEAYRTLALDAALALL